MKNINMNLLNEIPFTFMSRTQHSSFKIVRTLFMNEYKYSYI